MIESVNDVQQCTRMLHLGDVPIGVERNHTHSSFKAETEAPARITPTAAHRPVHRKIGSLTEKPPGRLTLEGHIKYRANSDCRDRTRQYVVRLSKPSHHAACMHSIVYLQFCLFSVRGAKLVVTAVGWDETNHGKLMSEERFDWTGCHINDQRRR